MERQQGNQHPEADWIQHILPDDPLFLEDQEVGGSKKQLTFKATGEEVLKVAKKLMQMANVVRISVWHDERKLVSIPIVYGGLMGAIFPYLSVFTLISMLALNCKIVVDKK